MSMAKMSNARYCFNDQSNIEKEIVEKQKPK